MLEGRNAAERLALEIIARGPTTRENIGLDKPVRDIFLGERQARDACVDAIGSPEEARAIDADLIARCIMHR